MTEQVVARQNSAWEQAGKILLPALTAALCAAGIAIPLMFIPAAVCGGAWYWFFRHSDAEFEYTFFDGVLDIAVVYRKTYRKELLSVRAGDTVYFGSAAGPDAARYLNGRGKIWRCDSARPDAASYCLAFPASGTSGRDKGFDYSEKQEHDYEKP